MVDELVKEEVLKTTDLEGPYTVHVKKGRLAGQTVFAHKHKVTGVYYYHNPDTGQDEPIGTENDVEVQKQQYEGVGYVYAKDRAKDPKSIPGEHWRVKFQSETDLKKHGNTEKSKVDETISKENTPAITAEVIFRRFSYWDISRIWKKYNDVEKASIEATALAITGQKDTEPKKTWPSIVSIFKQIFSSQYRQMAGELFQLFKKEFEDMKNLNQRESVSKKDVKSVIRELIDEIWNLNKNDVEGDEIHSDEISEMWADIGNVSNEEPMTGGEGGEKKMKPTGKVREPGADASLVDLYKGKGGQSDTSALPSVGGAMSEISDLTERKNNMNKSEFLKNVIRETIEEVRDEERIKEPQEQKNMRSLLRIRSYATWGIDNLQKQPKKITDVFNRIIMESDTLSLLQKRGYFDIGKSGETSLKTIETYAHYGINNIQSSPDKVVMILQRIIKQATELIEEYTQGFPSNVGKPIYEVSYEPPSTTDATAAADHAYQERQEVLAMKRIQSYAHWGYKHAKTHPNEVVGMFKKIADEIDGLVTAHEKGKEVSPSNVKEVAPPGWEGTVKAMKKHSVGGAKKWNPKKKKDEGMEEEAKKITNPYALAWWMKDQGYKSHK